jgi:hypothetical protein
MEYPFKATQGTPFACILARHYLTLRRANEQRGTFRKADDRNQIVPDPLMIGAEIAA